MKIFNWSLGHKVDIKHQREMAEKFYNDEPDLAMRIAMGEEKSPNGILSAAVYAKVCDEAEKAVHAEVKDSPEYIEKLEVCMKLGNSDNNREISAEAQRIKIREPLQAIEAIKDVVNARRDAFEKKLPAGESYKSTKKKMVEDMKKDLEFLEVYVEYFLNTQEKIKDDIKNIKSKTGQNLKDEQLIKDLWILRYLFLHLWFLGAKKPINQNELEVYISLIDRSFQTFKETSTYLTWLKKGFIEYAGTDQLKFSDLESFESGALEKVSEKIPLIAFDCTEGRMAGELHDFVIELLMTTVVQDKKIFEADNSDITAEEVGNIKNVIGDLKTAREKAGKEFFEDL